jgi:predicted RNA-binding protein YlxR (DUF448 family)
MSDVQPEHQPKTHAEAARQRRDAVTGVVMDEGRLIRFVAGPGGEVTADIGRKLPGRGVWIEANRAAVERAVKTSAFSRSAKSKLSAPPDLADQVETLLARDCLHRLGLARRSGVLTSGFEKVSSAVSAGKAAWLIEASDGSADGRGKLLSLARRSPRPPKVCGAFSADELGLALGLGHAIHTAFLVGRPAERFSEALGRLAGFRPILPERWSEEA